MEKETPSALLTDLYQLTMAQAYFHNGRSAQASFSLFVRAYPPNRGYFVAAGLGDALDFLSALAFDGAAIDYLHSTGILPTTLDYLGRRFTGAARARRRSRLFQGRPIQVTAPIVRAVVETFVIRQLNLQSLIATKAALRGRRRRPGVVGPPSLRRAHASFAGLRRALEALAGFPAPALARGKLARHPVVGTINVRSSRASRAGSTLPRLRQGFRTMHSLIVYLRRDRRRAEAAWWGADGRTRRAAAACASTTAISRPWRARFQAYSSAAGLKDVKIIGSGGLVEYDLAEF